MKSHALVAVAVAVAAAGAGGCAASPSSRLPVRAASTGASAAATAHGPTPDADATPRPGTTARYVLHDHGITGDEVVTWGPPGEFALRISDGKTYISTSSTVYLCGATRHSIDLNATDGGDVGPPGKPRYCTRVSLPSTVRAPVVDSVLGPYADPLSTQRLKHDLSNVADAGGRTVAGMPSRCIHATVVATSHPLMTICAAISGGFLTYTRAGADTATLTSVLHRFSSELMHVPDGVTFVYPYASP